MTKKEKLNEIMHKMFYTLEPGAHTFMECDCGRGFGRGTGKCIFCLAKELLKERGNDPS